MQEVRGEVPDVKAAVQDTVPYPYHDGPSSKAEAAATLGGRGQHHPAQLRITEQKTTLEFD